MPMPSLNPSVPIYDIIGLGFGPANLAIAGAIVEKWSANKSAAPLRQVLFIEKQQEFRWHPGMLLPNSRMQISFLKDLATLRSPQSPFTFLAYLHSQDRLMPFINRGSFTPTRREYYDYLSWAAERVQQEGVQVQFGEEVVWNHSLWRRYRGATGAEFFRRASAVDFSGLLISHAHHTISGNIVLSPGGYPRLPPALSSISPHPRLLHSANYVTSIDQVFASIPRPAAEPLRIAVIGSGQSSTEVLLDLYNRLNNLPIGTGERHELDMIFRKGSLKPSDDTPFSNEIFDPASTDMMFNLPTQGDRQRVLREYNSTNYSVVNPRTIDALYEVMYHQKLLDGVASRTGRDDGSVRVRINLRSHTIVSAAEDASAEVSNEHGGIHLTLHAIYSRSVSQKTYDAIVCGTGYDRDSWVRILQTSDLGEYFGLKPSSPIELVASGESGEEPAVSIFNDVDEMLPFARIEAQRPLTPIEALYLTELSSPAGKRGKEVALGEDAPRIYLQGCTQATHGLSESLLSILGVRAGSVVDELCEQ
ncbi:L-ornithine N(5)-monooxygenase [Grifola frondosa]|uniref:L-ornithine N(5)-monooxygenase [NAD(P)H] n=1 Tax=Grifola frondosa TaxID=5627 RepID=A0A1C7MLT2_GRIFR|nr:L-ornithine N(5)-monooxygenase [Grifola frondosa]